MSLIAEWSTTADDNGTLGTYPEYWPEGQPPSSVNDCARLLMSTIRTQWNDAQWFNWGYTTSRVSGNSFTVVTASWNTVNVADVFMTGGRIRLHDDAATLYGTITTVSVSAASVQVTFTPDNSSLTATASAVYNSIITADSKSLPGGTVPADVVRQSGAQIYGVDNGTSDAYAFSMTPTLLAYVAGESFNFFANSANTGASTVNIDGLGVKNLTLPNGSALPTNYIAGGSLVHIVYDGTKFQVLSANSSGGGGASAATQADQEAATSTTIYVSPGRQQYHPLSPKAWGYIQPTGTLSASYGISMVTQTGTGKIQITWSVAFSTQAYNVNVCLYTQFNRIGSVDNSTLPAQTQTTVNCLCINAVSSTVEDPESWEVTAFGDQ